MFLFTPGVWLGEGKIELNMVKEELDFVTRWNVGFINQFGLIDSNQEIQVKGLADSMNNQFTLSHIGSGSFDIELENQSMGKVVGQGLVTDKTIAWEFRMPELGFEGMEFYELQQDKSYKMRAEYSTSDEYRTLIQGRVWAKKEETA